MTDKPLTAAFSKALQEHFGPQSLAVAEKQLELADDHNRIVWGQIVEDLKSPA